MKPIGKGREYNKNNLRAICGREVKGSHLRYECGQVPRFKCASNPSNFAAGSKPSNPGAGVNFSNDTENIKTLVKLQQKNFELLMYIKHQNNQILANVSQPLTTSFTTLPLLPTSLPVDTIYNLKILDEFLRANSETRELLCSYLSSLGGKDVTNKTNRILKYLLSDDVAKNYNFYGKRTEKEAFCNLILCSTVVRAVKMKDPTASDKEVEDGIKGLVETCTRTT
ncbi:hypothetical protein NQ317_016316 [Molorchus minor]|uniref:DUF4806 domain-containing protein n=1 Tax=Molorchus minor TaxID=1323400 RepID=A0ABQ9JA26_9CUCU|nr:hypothetical protein NQ317_016316 [Molorchus minor]